jgi:rhodanese-related sulfurtransferase
MPVQQMTPAELARHRAAGTAPAVLDVREDTELGLVSLPDVTHIPMRQIANRAPQELDPDAPVVVLCHHGVRSMAVANWLDEQDFSAVWNLAGGIDRYAVDVDPSIGRY